MKTYIKYPLIIASIVLCLFIANGIIHMISINKEINTQQLETICLPSLREYELRKQYPLIDEYISNYVDCGVFPSNMDDEDFIYILQEHGLYAME